MSTSINNTISENIQESEPGLYKLPDGWVWTQIPDVIGNFGIFTDGDWVESKDQDPDGEIRLIQLADIGDGIFKDKSQRFLTYQKSLELNCTFLSKDDILVSRLGEPLGKSCLFPKDGKKYVTVVDVCIIRGENRAIEQKYLMHLINSPQYRKVISTYSSGTTRKRISRKNLSKIYIPLPPLAEQHRIVEKIEEEFTRLDAGVSALKRAKALIPKYRQSVLKAAMCGDLTKEWRALHPDVENSCQVIELNKCATKITDGEHFRPKTIELGIPFLSAKDILNSGLSFDKPLYISEETCKKSRQRCNPEKGDILVVSRGAGIGRTCIVQTNQIFCLLGSVILIKPFESINNKFVLYSLKSPNINKKITSISGSTAQQAIYIRDIKNLKIFLPPLEEQHEIVSEIERRFSIIDEMERVVDESLLKAERLRQSVLKKAFEGRLVPQNPDDEPAGVLLERIRAEKEMRAKEGKAEKTAAKIKKSAGKKKAKKAESE